MKLTVIVMLVSLMQVSAATFGQNVTLKENRITLEKVFLEIRKQTGYSVFLSSEEVKLSTLVNADFTNVPLSQVVSKVLEGLPLSYSIDQKTIVIRETEKGFLDNVTAYLARLDVFGKVVDANGNPIPGATIKVKGEELARTTTNSRGEFGVADLSPNAVLQISYIGYRMVEVKASDFPKTIKLEVSNDKLDEIQVVGYGTTTQRTSTGSVGTITSKDIEKQPVNNILDALIGRIPGLQITPTSGIQGAAPKVKIRGQTSILATNDPLYILDGVPVSPTQALQVYGALDNNSSLNLLLSLNTTDIESVSVLKDADATAIYGSRGANGVILITTKRGKAGKMAVNLKAYTGIQNVANRVDMLDINQYLAMRKEAFANEQTYAGSTDVPDASNAPDLVVLDPTKITDWQQLLLDKTAISNDLGLSLSGGTENTRYYISGGYHKEGSVMPGDSKSIRKSISASINSSSEDKKFNMYAQTSYSETSLNLLPTNLVNSIFVAPHIPIYNADGSPNWDYVDYPFANTLQNYFAPTQNLAINGLASYEFIPGLKLKVTGGINRTRLKMSEERPVASQNPAFSPISTLVNQRTENNNWIVEPQLEYNHSINKHNFGVLLGSTFQKSLNSSLALNGSGFSNDNLISNIGAAGSVTLSNVLDIPYNYNAFFGRLSYNFNQEVLANVTFRRDGSSRFGDGNKFGNFGAVGLGWVFTQREWLKNTLPFLSYGKIRGSYGITGNDQIGNFAYLATYYPGFGGYNGSTALVPERIPNPSLQWETTKKLEAAVELGFFNDRVLFTGAFFRNRSDNTLVNNNVSTQTGFFSYVANFPGLIENKGYEFELSTKNIKGAFAWNTSINFSKSDNKLVSYPNFAASQYSNTYRVGESLNLKLAYQLSGLDATGLPVYRLADGSLSQYPDNKDRIIAGDNDPMYGGISNDFSYKGFNLGVFVSYTRQFGLPGYIPNNVVGSSSTTNWSTYVLGRWQKPGDEANTIIPRFTTDNYAYYTFYFLDADQLYKPRHIFRLSNVSLGYTLPNSLTSKLKLGRTQLYVNGQNLYVFDKHREFELDPQTGNSSLPLLRTFVFGINASF